MVLAPHILPTPLARVYFVFASCLLRVCCVLAEIRDTTRLHHFIASSGDKHRVAQSCPRPATSGVFAVLSRAAREQSCHVLS